MASASFPSDPAVVFGPVQNLSNLDDGPRPPCANSKLETGDEAVYETLSETIQQCVRKLKYTNLG